jgi:UDP-N-acetylglucosamine 3-dehydrogenase
MVDIGILGSGAMGAAHADAYASIPGVRVAAVSSRSTEKAAALGQRIGAEFYTDPDRILDDDKIDAISITLPTHLHEKYATAALERGKHVLLEKPMALTIESCDAIIATAEENRRILMIGQVLRFWPEYVAVANLIKEEKLGGPLSASAFRLSARPRWSEWFDHPDFSGGAVLDLHIHDLDTCNWLFGKPHSIYSRGLRGPTGSWDHVLSLLDYGTCQAHVEASWMMPDGFPFAYGFSILYENSAIVFDPSREEAQRLRLFLPSKDPMPLPFEKGNAYATQAAYFIDCICNDIRPQRGSAQQGRAAVATSLAARHSLETDEIVYFDPDYGFNG